MNRTPHIGIDIETLSLRPTASIIAIAFKTFFFDGAIDEDHSATFCVDATSCAMYGLHVEPRCIAWWHDRPADAKKFFLDSPSVKLKEALEQVAQLYEDVKMSYNCHRPLIWVQGSDFDIAILRNAYRSVFDDNDRSIPWPHDCVRDARTYVLSGLSLLDSVGYFRGFDPPYDPDRPYDILPKRNNWIPHNADSDVLQMIWNIRFVTAYLREAITDPPPSATF